jgi:hypothetical protein
MVMTTPPPPQGLLNLPFGNIKTDLGTAVEAVKTLDGFVNGPFGALVPGTIKTALDDLTKVLTIAETFLNITPA